jgi:hypothetical protein
MYICFTHQRDVDAAGQDARAQSLLHPTFLQISGGRRAIIATHHHRRRRRHTYYIRRAARTQEEGVEEGRRRSAYVAYVEDAQDDGPAAPEGPGLLIYGRIEEALSRTDSI